MSPLLSTLIEHNSPAAHSYAENEPSSLRSINLGENNSEKDPLHSARHKSFHSEFGIGSDNSSETSSVDEKNDEPNRELTGKPLKSYENKCRLIDIIVVVVLVLGVGGVLLYLNKDRVFPSDVEIPLTEENSKTSAPTYPPPSPSPTTSSPTITGEREAEILGFLREIDNSLDSITSPEDLIGSYDVVNITFQKKAAEWVTYLDPLLLPYTSSWVVPRYVLAVIYYSTGGVGPNETTWKDSTGWLTNKDTCDWFGIICDAMNASIISLELVNNGLVGSLPIEVTYLPFLTEFSVFKNNLSQAPPSFSSLSHLELLDLRANEFTGPLPQDIALMPNLGIVYLSNNHFNGTIPKEIGKSKSIETLTLHGNDLTGAMPLDLCYIPDLTSDCTDATPINCSCCINPVNQCY